MSLNPNFFDRFIYELEDALRKRETNKIKSKDKLETLSNSNGKNFNGTFFDKFNVWLDNAMLGDLDYARQVEMFNKQMAFNSAEAAKQREFNLYTSNSAYQRQAEDLQRAGYNPALVLGGGGATVASSSSANVGTPNVKSSGDEFGAVLALIANSALSLANNAITKNTSIANNLLSSDTQRDIQTMKNDTSWKIALLNHNKFFGDDNSALYSKPRKPVPYWLKK